MKTFYHPSRGHWVAIRDPGPEFLAQYPEGTVEIPNAPEGAHRWDNDARVWIPVEPEEQPAP